LRNSFMKKLIMTALLSPLVLLNAQTIQNTLMLPWQEPYNGVPPFDKVRLEDFAPAIEAGMAEKMAEIDKIVSNPEQPTFANTIVALEKTGQSLDRVLAIYYIWSSNMNSEAFQPIEDNIEPKLAAYRDKIYQNFRLFKRIEAVYQSPTLSQMRVEEQRLVEKYYKDFVQSGAKLDAATKQKVTEINQKLAGLFTKFSQHLLSDETEKYLELKNISETQGLPDALVKAAANNAASLNKKGWIIFNTRSSVEPFLTYASNRTLREKAWRMFTKRGDNGDTNDNNMIVSEILSLRAQRANLIGYPTHAHWRLANTMAKTPERTLELMEAIWPAAVARAQEEVTDMQVLVDKEGSKFKIEPWDYRYYAEKVRKSRYDLDQNEVKQYLQLDQLRNGLFWVAEQMFGLTFKPALDVPVYHPDVRVWVVNDKASGKQVGLWYFDPYARKGKRSGAWMNAYRDQQKVIGNITTIVSNNANFIKGKPGEAVLISWDDARTLFHEFGHALHGLCSDVTYPSLSGTNVARDYVEFPSQLLERWLSTPEVLQRFALHYQTRKPIPAALVSRISNAARFNQGFSTVELMASALVDMKLHLAGDTIINAAAFEAKTLKELNMPKEIVMRHRIPQFAHIFSGDDYSAGYYSYLWSDVLSADAYEAFTESKGPYDKEVLGKLHKYVFSIGNTIDPEEGYRLFRGKDPDIQALMRNKGFNKK
ncbi:MAG TPA: M3 family metallopeptidase, partial [Cytophagales bacterium]|nr:M3 family metallopeptidase [Cytophagales bacterium]